MRTKHRSATVSDTTTRSMLEARWAIFFRELGLGWTYEPETFTHNDCKYTPDFLIDGFGYVEIKPTIQLFVQESSKRVAKVIASNPNIKLWVFCSGRVQFEVVALYHRGKLYSVPPSVIVREISACRTGAETLTAFAHVADIRRAMSIANTTRLNEWASSKEIVLDVIESMQRRFA